jgi:hypothetical protein
VAISIETLPDGTLDDADLDNDVSGSLSIIDDRSDPEGYIFGGEGWEQRRIQNMQSIDAEFALRADARIKLLGAVIQPLTAKGPME